MIILSINHLVFELNLNAFRWISAFEICTHTFIDFNVLYVMSMTWANHLYFVFELYQIHFNGVSFFFIHSSLKHIEAVAQFHVPWIGMERRRRLLPPKLNRSHFMRCVHVSKRTLNIKWKKWGFLGAEWEFIASKSV